MSFFLFIFLALVNHLSFFFFFLYSEGAAVFVVLTFYELAGSYMSGGSFLCYCQHVNQNNRKGAKKQPKICCMFIFSKRKGNSESENTQRVVSGSSTLRDVWLYSSRVCRIFVFTGHKNNLNLNFFNFLLKVH